MATVADMFALALQHHQTGNLQPAEQLYRRIIQIDPRHADSYHLLGVLAHQAGQYAVAVASIKHALSLQPWNSVYYSNLGLVHEAAGQMQEALACFEQALRLQPHVAEAHYAVGNALKALGRLEEAAKHTADALLVNADYAEAHHNLGTILFLQQKSDEAITHFQSALRLKPNYIEAHGNLGVALAAKGKLDEAIAHYREALRLNPHYAEAHANLGNAFRKLGKTTEALMHCQEAVRLRPDFAGAHCNLGMVLADMDRHLEAVASYRDALRLNPNYADAHNNLSIALLKLRLPEEAATHCAEAVRLRPNHAEAHNNLGMALVTLGKLDQAIGHLQEALRILPNFAGAHNNLATALCRQGLLVEALAECDEALRLTPDFPEARWNRSLMLLRFGNFEDGWAEGEWRWKQPDSAPLHADRPIWDGSALAGRSILLHAEQGMGDTLNFIRYAPLVKQRGGTVIVECQAPLAQLLRSVPRIDQLVPRGSPLPDFDVQVPLMSLPALFHTNLDTIPAEIPYLHADEDLVNRWQPELNESAKGQASAECDVRSASSPNAPSTSHSALRDSRFLVGIAWQGSPSYRYDRQRSISLAEFAPLAKVPGVKLISLQKGPGTEQLHTVADTFPVENFGNRLDATAGAFIDTGAIMNCLDLVITSDTALPHLAGALGVPVWVALPFVADWRWLLKREDSPWYPTVRLFRQTNIDQWDHVFERMATELKQLTNPMNQTEPRL